MTTATATGFTAAAIRRSRSVRFVFLLQSSLVASLLPDHLAASASSSNLRRVVFPFGFRTSKWRVHTGCASDCSGSEPPPNCDRLLSGCMHGAHTLAIQLDRCSYIECHDRHTGKKRLFLRCTAQLRPGRGGCRFEAAAGPSRRGHLFSLAPNPDASNLCVLCMPVQLAPEHELNFQRLWRELRNVKKKIDLLRLLLRVEGDGRTMQCSCMADCLAWQR